jgi:hypothetical protein
METPISSKIMHSVGCPSVVHPLLRGIFDTQVAHAQLELLAGRPAYQASATELLLRLDVIGRSPRKNSLVFMIVIIDYYCRYYSRFCFFILSGLLLLILDFRRNSWPFSWISLSDLIQVFVQFFVTFCHLYSGKNRLDNKPKSHMCFQRKEIWSISHRIHVWYIC